ncbi:response regulator transcription factor [Clostridium sp. 'deep sea']|uniref:response regulator transcription factor n=1 Tax=Clostridium sp. 'deep sea' TaxID=2779445 RepID=UPI0018969DC1|nr:response regulator transcription factor [Clostridium sp. 'deep sea']QOR34921.1 response regulator transcription factor [Clostridium sp. 'deep sea']
MIKVLIVEDNIAIADLIEISLSNLGYKCTKALSGDKAADLIEQYNYDLILLDIMLPEINGYELMQFIKPLKIAVIFITAKASLADKLKGFNLGADDYLTKPFAIEELIARVQSVLRRTGKACNLLEIDNITINLAGRTVMQNNKQINLTVKEFDLLLTLAENKNILLYREKLYEKIWEKEWCDNTRTIDLHIQRLRKKLNWNKQIKTVYKLGYMLESK